MEVFAGQLESDVITDAIEGRKEGKFQWVRSGGGWDMEFAVLLRSMDGRRWWVRQMSYHMARGEGRALRGRHLQGCVITQALTLMYTLTLGLTSDCDCGSGITADSMLDSRLVGVR
ncbi:uncharacterized protein BDV14DRAFT_174958 [Aspergillus stella-maris]|uniref:uncharacterized protein n=1 Tax=Aspergillus stella-maris TaxID=1810926 RepID=UPI003CCCAB6E